MVKICIYIRDFEILKVSIASLPILKNKLSIKLLLNLDKKDIITTLKSKSNDGVSLLRLKKMLLLNNFISANISIIYKMFWS